MSLLIIRPDFYSISLFEWERLSEFLLTEIGVLDDYVDLDGYIRWEAVTHPVGDFVFGTTHTGMSGLPPEVAGRAAKELIKISNKLESTDKNRTHIENIARIMEKASDSKEMLSYMGTWINKDR